MNGNEAVRLGEIFNEKCIFLHLEAEGKDDALEALVKALVTAHGLIDGTGILNSIRERESKMSTGIKKGIALPHGKIGDIGAVRGAIGIFDRGVDFEALDNFPVYVIFLFVSDKNKPDQHLYVLRKISEICEKDDFLEQMLSADSVQAVRKLIE